MKIVIYHNPRCSKSRATLALLREHGVNPEVVEYLKTPPDRGEIEALLSKLNAVPRDIVRTGEAAYRDLQLDAAENDPDALIDSIAANPILLQRPIVVAGDRAVIGRPPEAVLDLLDA